MGATTLARPITFPRVLPRRTLSDERLARLVWEQGDEESFAILYERYREPLSRYCRSIVRDPEDARDAQQNTMMSALRALRRRPLDGRVKPWLYRIAHNESITVLRRRRPTEQLDEATPARGAASEELETWESLLLDLRSLPERQRAALLMRELAGLEYEEIAVALSGTAVAARKSVFEARAALAETAAGRSAACEDIRRKISDCDGRALRARRVRGHLDSCVACSAFADSVRDRRRVLGTIPVLPVSALGLLGGAAGVGGAAGAGGAAGVGAAGVAVGGGATGALVLKGGLALCAMCAIAGTGVVLGGHAAPVKPRASVSRPASHAARTAHHGVARRHLTELPQAQRSHGHGAASARPAQTIHLSAQAAPAQPSRPRRVLSVLPRSTRAAARPVQIAPVATPAPSSTPAPTRAAPATGAPAATATPLAGLESSLVAAVLARLPAAGLAAAEQQATAALAAGGAGLAEVRQASSWLDGILAHTGLAGLSALLSGQTAKVAGASTPAPSGSTATSSPATLVQTLLEKFFAAGR